MSTLIVPCLGRKFINGIPQYLYRHPNGKLLIERSIEGVFSGIFDKVLIVLLENDVYEYQADNIIKAELKKYPIEIVTLNQMTSGPAETIYNVLCKLNVVGPIVIKDVDNYIEVKFIPQGNFVAGLDLNLWERDIHKLKDKSFLILNEQGNLLDIIEKQVRSDVICLGLYGFNKAEDFIKAFKKLNDINYPITKLYVSHIISYLIGYLGRVFHYVSVSEYENWGDERLWKDLQRDYTLYFIDLDNIFSENGSLSDEVKDKLIILQKRGASFIGYTVEDTEYKTHALKTLQNVGLKFIKIIYGCPYSEKKEIIASEEELKRKVIEL